MTVQCILYISILTLICMYRPNKLLCTDTYYNPNTASIDDREWLTPFNSFNNILHAMITFFEVSTEESWPDVMYAAIDSVDVD